jgi:uncharacterized membrane protein YedE/YeeE
LVADETCCNVERFNEPSSETTLKRRRAEFAGISSGMSAAPAPAAVMSFDHEQIGFSLLGGALIGAASGLYLLAHGRIAGISGIVSGILDRAPDWRTRAAFAAGLVATGAVLGVFFPGLFGVPQASLALVALAGLLVGFGTRLGNGCTSGHGVCGVARLSRRSLVATATFILTGALTVLTLNRLGGAQ